MRTFLKRARGSEGREAAHRALLEAGIGVVEVDDWNQAADQLAQCGALLVVCEGEIRDEAAAARVAHAIAVRGEGKRKGPEPGNGRMLERLHDAQRVRLLVLRHLADVVHGCDRPSRTT